MGIVVRKDAHGTHVLSACLKDLIVGKWQIWKRKKFHCLSCSTVTKNPVTIHCCSLDRDSIWSSDEE